METYTYGCCVHICICRCITVQFVYEKFCMANGTYQSMVQQFINDGYIRIRSLNDSPMGENAKATCNCSRTRSMKNAYISLGNGSTALPYGVLCDGNQQQNQ